MKIAITPYSLLDFGTAFLELSRGFSDSILLKGWTFFLESRVLSLGKGGVDVPNAHSSFLLKRNQFHPYLISQQVVVLHQVVLSKASFAALFLYRTSFVTTCCSAPL